MISRRNETEKKKRHNFTFPLFINVAAGSVIIIKHKNRKDKRVDTILWLIYHV